jgi:dienelactone hydrolase
MQSEKIEYKHDGKVFEAHLVRPDGAGPRPAVLVAHAWGGRDEFAEQRAVALAELGYVGFAMDVYGKGVRGTTNDQCAKLMTPLMQDRDLLAARLAAGMAAAAAHPAVDGQRMGAIGFCFGGLCVLDMARRGADLRGVVAFHGLLKAPERPMAARVRARVLALHGYDDPMATPADVLTFAREMTEARADWQLHAYGGTMHAFTNPEANDPGFGTVYQPRAAQRSWTAMTSFFEECFGEVR